ncbi:MAG: hypothetical protein ABJR46_19030 [Tateyamaria sp.]|uniref:hypothetical protein n=1 Tax=Tateyamaria sp. TaxID=1929288 RepID=UPI0032A06A4E
MILNISLVLETEKEKNARVVVSRLNKVISAGTPVLERYHKGGTKALLKKGMSDASWPEAMLTGLTVAQSFGRAWTIYGDAQEELNLVGAEFSVVGINWCEISLSRKDF